MPTTSVYPGALDTFAAHGATMDLVEQHENLHLTMEDAIEKIEVELGTNPSGSSATVAARFATLGLVAPPGLLSGDSLNYGTVGSDVTNLTVTWTAQTGVRYRTVANIPWLQKDGAGAAQVELRILDGTNAVLLRRPFEVAANEDFGMRLEHVEPTLLLNGSRTRKAFIITSAGDVDIFGATSTASLTVEALGFI